MNLFITGGSGFLGKNLIKELVKDIEIEKIYCLEHKSPIDVKSQKLIRMKGNVSDIDKVRIDAPIDKMIVITGVTNGRNASIADTFKVNFEGTKKAITFCNNNLIKNIVFVSSINVMLSKKGAYAKSKVRAEKAVIDSGLNYTIFRPALIYGYNQPMGLGVIEKCIKNYGIVPIFGNGKKLEQPVHVKECSQIMAWYIMHSQNNRIIPITGRTPMAYNDLCLRIGKLMEKKTRLVHVPAKPFEMLLSFSERMEICLPISVEQIYHIDSDLDYDMSDVYKEVQFKTASFEDLYLLEEA